MSERPATRIRKIAEQGLEALKGNRRITVSLRAQLREYFSEIEQLAAKPDARTGTAETTEPYT